MLVGPLQAARPGVQRSGPAATAANENTWRACAHRDAALRARRTVRVLVVIVNYRAAHLVVPCLASLAGERGGRHDVRAVVVDNPGGDESGRSLARAIAERGWTDWAEVRVMPKNGGFSYGVNAGVQPALASSAPPDAFLLLNPDTWVRPGAVAALADFLDARPDVGMAGSRLEDPDGTPQHSRFRFPSLANEFDHALGLGMVTRLLKDRVTCPPIADHPHEIDWLSGASMIVRRTVFEQVGPFDEGYFLYFEELDFARRAHALGLRSFYVPASRVVHHVGQSTGVTRRERPRRTPAYWFRSRRRYYRKHHHPVYRLLVDLSFVLGRAAGHVLRVLRKRPYEGPPHFLRDFIRHNLWPGRQDAAAS
jgi:N-acetylglucosaminyl-diphospho-decaprenol L-rhamnosyltransferase